MTVVAVEKDSPGSKNSNVKVWRTGFEAEVGHKRALPAIPRELSLTMYMLKIH